MTLRGDPQCPPDLADSPLWGCYFQGILLPSVLMVTRWEDMVRWCWTGNNKPTVIVCCWASSLVTSSPIALQSGACGAPACTLFSPDSPEVPPVLIRDFHRWNDANRIRTITPLVTKKPVRRSTLASVFLWRQSDVVDAPCETFPTI